MNGPFEENQNINSERLIMRVLVIMLVLVLVFCCYLITQSVIDAQNTGLLEVNTSKSGSIISISRDDTEAKVIGAGHAKVRLAPGIYHLVALGDGKQDSETIKIAKKQHINIFMAINKTSGVPSASDINFKNIDVLVDNGLTADQLSSVKQYFFQYKPGSREIVIDSSSFQFNHDPASGAFTMKFTGAIDGMPFSGAASYTDINNVRLQIFSPETNALVFDSATQHGAE